MHFSNASNTATLTPLLGGVVTLNGQITENVVRAGLNWRFAL
jgi:hypothetical protein